MTKSIFLPAFLIEERKNLKSGLYHIEGVLRDNGEYGAYYSSPYFIEIRKAKLLDDLGIQQEQWGIPTKEYGWGHNDIRINLNKFKRGFRSFLSDAYLMIKTLLVAVLLILAILVFLQEAGGVIASLKSFILSKVLI